MDSPNSSGSMQSSSGGGGGDEEYDSCRGASSMSALLSSNPNSNHSLLGNDAVSGLPRHHQLLQSAAALHSPTLSAMFDPLSNFFDPPTTTTTRPAANPIHNPDLNGIGLGAFGQLAPLHLQNLYNSQGTEPEGLRPLGSSASRSAPSDQHHPPVCTDNNSNSNGLAGNNNGLGIRNPKKRSRASRRAPTTVLTTDTTNFRAMVQEFTGIPAPPFTSGSPFQRTRLDLFGSGSGAPSYLLRPLAQKLQPQNPVPPFAAAPPPPPPSASSGSSFIDALASATAGNTISNTDIGLLRPSPSFLNQNAPSSGLDFQTLFQNRYPIASSSSTSPPKTLGLEIPGSDQNSTMNKIGELEEFGLGQAQVSNNHDNNFGRVGNGDRGAPGSGGGARGEGGMVESWICSSD